MPTVLHYLTNQNLNRLDEGVQRLERGQGDGAELRRQAQQCLTAVRPLHSFIDRNDRILGTFGFIAFVTTLVSLFAMLGTLTNPNLSQALSSGLTAATSGLLLMAASLISDRVESAVALANEVLEHTGA